MSVCVCGCGVPYFEQHRYLSNNTTGIYPPNLTLNNEQNKLPLHMLDILILYDNHRNNYYTTSWEKGFDPKYQALPNTNTPSPPQHSLPLQHHNGKNTRPPQHKHTPSLLPHQPLNGRHHERNIQCDPKLHLHAQWKLAIW